MATHPIELETLSPAEKRILLNQLLKKNNDAKSLASKGQAALWFLYQSAPKSAAYNIMYAANLHCSVNIDAMKKAFSAILVRHDALHTTFALIDGALIRKISPDLAIPFDCIDTTTLTEEACRALIENEAHQPFDLEQGPVCKMRLFLRGQQPSVLLFVVHHIAVDGTSLDILMNEFSICYNSFVQGNCAPSLPTPIPYENFTSWEQLILNGPKKEKLESYWRHALAGPLPRLDIPQTARPHAAGALSALVRPEMQTFVGAEYLFSIDNDLAKNARRYAQEQSITLYVLFQAVLKTLLYRYTREATILLGTYVARRELGAFEGAVGYYLNTVVLKSTFDEKISFNQLVAKVREATFDALEHQDFPFPLLVETLQPKRDNSRSPLFDVVFNWVSASGHHILNDFFLSSGNEKRDCGELVLSNYPLSRRFARFDLEIAMGEAQGEISAYWQYNTAIFSPETITAMTEHFQQILKAALKAPMAPVASLDMLPEAEFNTIIHAWNKTTSAYTKTPIHRLIEKQANHKPDALALWSRGQKLTYDELNARANQVAHALRALEVSTGSLVGLCVERSSDLFVGILAILKAGAAYVPLDPEYPSDRINFMLSDSHVNIALVSKKTISQCTQEGLRYVVLDDSEAAFLQESRENLVNHAETAEQTAYVMYTSGSTGKPKGVIITHRNVAALFHWADSVFNDEELQGVLASTSICFDISVFEIFYPLIRGGSIILAENALHLSELPADCSVKLINTVPSVMDALLKTMRLPPSVKVVTLVGEPLRKSLVDRIYAGGCVEKVFNLYGPTEDTVFSTCKLVERGSEVEPSIGRPLPNTQTYICNEALKPVPIFHVGELLLGGDGLAEGYHERPDLNEERFVKNPFAAEASPRLYKTGDLARYLPNGEIEYLGRLDSQIKIRGFRVELGEIEVLLSQHACVRAAAVIAKEENCGKRLVAFIEPKLCKDQAGEIDDLKGYLETLLPAHMVPSAFILVDELPKTPNGKIDRKALLQFQANDLADAHVDKAYLQAPRTESEQIVATIWSELLQIPREKIGVKDLFYDLGGHSLLMAQMAPLISTRFQKSVALQDLFRFRDIESLAAWLDGAKEASLLPESNRRAAQKIAALKRIKSDRSNSFIN